MAIETIREKKINVQGGLRSVVTRRRTMQSLGQISEYLGRSELNFLTEAAVQDADGFVREYATTTVLRAAALRRPGSLEALGRILGFLRPRSGRTLLARTGGMNRALAAQMLGRLADSLDVSQVRELFKAAVGDPEVVVRVNALKALGLAARKDRPEALALLLQILEDPKVGDVGLMHDFNEEKAALRAHFQSCEP